MIAIKLLVECYCSHTPWLEPGYAEIAQQISPNAFEFRLRERRVANDVGEQGDCVSLFFSKTTDTDSRRFDARRYRYRSAELCGASGQFA